MLKKGVVLLGIFLIMSSVLVAAYQPGRLELFEAKVEVQQQRQHNLGAIGNESFIMGLVVSPMWFVTAIEKVKLTIEALTIPEIDKRRIGREVFSTAPKRVAATIRQSFEW